MKESCFPVRNKLVMSLKWGAPLANLRRKLAFMYRARKRNQFGAITMLSFTITSCASNAQIANETATGGTVLYLYTNDQEVLASAGRRDALRLLEKKCPTGYTISREGRISLIDKAVDKAWMGQVSRDGQPSREKRWAIQFVCK
jgi:hypothetical protein